MGVLFVLALGGCAVGDFLVGAPSPRERVATSGLLARRCGGCHAVPSPQSMSAEEWRAAVDRMHRRMTLPDAEWDSLALLARRGAGRRAPEAPRSGSRGSGTLDVP